MLIAVVRNSCVCPCLIVGLSACVHAVPDSNDISLTSPSAYARLVGQRIELVGVVSQTRIPQILGVDVEPLESYRGRKVSVNGILRQSVVTQKQLEHTERQMGGQVAHRGPGTYYRLEDVRFKLLP